MKQILQYLFLVLVSSTVLVACKNTNSPDQTATKFLSSMYSMDFELARSLSTKNTWNIIKILEHKTKDVTEEEKSALIGKLKVTITEIIPETDSTELVYFTTEPDFQIFPALRILSQTDADGRVRYKVDNSSLDSLSGGDALIVTENMKPFEEDTVIVEPVQ